MKTKKVLIVDDDRNWTEILRYGLEQEGFRVVVANNGDEGVKMALKEKPGVVLMDMVMPYAWGHDASQRIKTMLDTDAPKVIFLTAMKRVEDERRALSGGADAYMTKPVKPAAVAEMIRRLSGKR